MGWATSIVFWVSMGIPYPKPEVLVVTVTQCFFFSLRETHADLTEIMPHGLCTVRGLPLKI